MSDEWPDDIRIAAQAVVERGYDEGLIDAVCRALMAERERVAAFAYAKHDWPARWIAASLRGENEAYQPKAMETGELVRRLDTKLQTMVRELLAEDDREFTKGKITGLGYARQFLSELYAVHVDSRERID